MAQQATPEQFCLQIGRTWLFAGLSWQYLPLHGRRSMRLRAREAKANHWSSLPIGDGKVRGSLLGTVDITDKSLLRPSRHILASMALTVLPALSEDCYAVFQLPHDRYWFVAVSDGMLSPFCDMVGNEETIRTAVNIFLQINPVPANGWTVYAPAGFYPEIETEECELAPLVANKVSLRRARLYKTHNRHALWVQAGVAIVLLGCYWGYATWQAHLKRSRVRKWALSIRITPPFL